jgi:class 3 adenylate cyclase/predicted ATPase
MSFYDQLDKIIEILRQRGRVSYRALKREFDLDEALLEDFKVELVDVQRLARDERGTVLVWIGAEGAPARTDDRPPSVPPPLPPSSRGEAERRQVTVMFCDLVRSTELAGQLDPEELRDLLRAYQDAADEIVRRFGGVIARYVGDGLLIYFGYPHAHEDDAERAVRAGLGIVGAVRDLHGRLQATLTPLRDIPLQVRIGLHTGLAVMGTIGDSTHRDDMTAVGETPSVAARVQGCADPDTVLLTEPTHRLLRGTFACAPLGPRAFEGITAPVALYRVARESEATEPHQGIGGAWSTPLVGREREVGLLLERWAQVKEGVGQIALITGEAGIGKSRLKHSLTTHVLSEPHLLLEARCSPYHQHSALYPLTELLARALGIARHQSVDERLTQLERTLSRAGLSPADVVPFLAPLLSLPLPETRYAPLALSPERHRQRTLETAVALVLGLSTQQPVLVIVEDLHWVDPSTLEWVTRLVEQAPTARLFALLTARPDFSPPWGARAHVAALTLGRLRRTQIEHLILGIAGSKMLPPQVIEQVATKTDGVPLFVEELTKMVLESGLLREEADRYELVGSLPPLAIPATLQDSLMARLDRLATVKVVAQMGATIGRAFPYALLQAVAALDEDTLRAELGKLVEAELLYQRGVPPRAIYTFKHALIQDAAYQTLLKSTRPQYHRRIAQALEARFPELVETQPELLAHHYTEAGLGTEALPYWQRAGEKAAARSAYPEAIAHLTRALDLLDALPQGPARVQREITLRLARGASLMAARGYASPEVELEYGRARALCRHVEDSPFLFRVLGGLHVFYLARGELETARQFAQQCMTLAERGGDTTHVVRSSTMLGQVGLHLGDVSLTREHLARGISLYRAGRYRPRAAGQDPIVVSLSYDAWCLWFVGFPDRASELSREALALAHERAQPYELAGALLFAALFDELRREGAAIGERADALIALASEQGYPTWLAFGLLMSGWAQVDQGLVTPGIAQMRRGLAAMRSTGFRTGWPYHLALMAKACARLGDVDEALDLQAEAIAAAHGTGEHCWDAELCRIEGDLRLQQAVPDRTQAEASFRRAIEAARRSHTKAWELRAVTSLARLLRDGDHRAEGRRRLADVYAWFTEGFETHDLREARALLDGLGEPAVTAPR